MAKVTLFEFTRNMMQQLGGDEFHVDLRHDRSRSVDRMESAAAAVCENAAGQDRGVGEGEVGDVVWPELDYTKFRDEPIHGPCPGCGRTLNLRLEGCFCEVIKQEELDAEAAFFKSRDANRR